MTTTVTSNPCLISDDFEGNSPFQKNIVLGYYDGVTEAVAGVLGQAFYIKMLAWDANQDVRCYAVMELEHVPFSELEQMFTSFGLPCYPDWFPKLGFSDKQLEDDFRNRLHSVIEKKSAVRWVMLGENISGVVKIRKMAADITNPMTQSQGDSAIGEWVRYFQNT